MRRSVFAIALILGQGLCAHASEAGDYSAQFSAWRTRVERARQDYEAFAAEARSRVTKPRKSALETSAHARDYMSDETLRSGDVVVTDAGLMVFTGEPRLDHDAKDFKKLKQWRGDLRYSARLFEIERANASAPR
jgi:hypothetical protein